MSGDMTIKRLDDGRLSVLQADPVVEADVEVLDGPLDKHCTFDGEFFTVEAVEGMFQYRVKERHRNYWGAETYRMERIDS